jgi:TonB family protein
MRQPVCAYFAAIFLAVIVLPPRASAQEGTGSPAPQQSASPATPSGYPESTDGLAKQVQELFTAEKTDDSNKIAAIYAAFQIPKHDEWFKQAFGEKEGQGLDAKYSQSLEQWPIHLRSNVKRAIQQNGSEVSAEAYAKPEEIKQPLLKAFQSAMTAPAVLYVANANIADSKSPYFLGDFVYVDGSFRYIDWQVMQALSTAPPIRVRVGGNVMSARIVNRVQPVYPEAARQTRVGGTVRLHVVVAKDGSVLQLVIVSGDPLLQLAAVDAVKQWKYQPTLLNGQPVEVDTLVDVIFQLSN